MVSKTKFPGICNNCGKKSEFYIRCGIHTLQLCGSCLNNLALEARALIVKSNDEPKEYNNSVEIGLIQDTGKVPPTGGVV